MTIRKIMLSLLGTLALCTAMLAWTGFSSSSALQKNLTGAMDNVVPSLTAVGEMRHQFSESRGLFAELAAADTVEKTMEIDERLSAQMGQADKALSTYEKMLTNDEDRKLYNQVKTSWATWKTEADPIRGMALSFDNAGAREKLYGSFVAVAKSLDDSVLALVKYKYSFALVMATYINLLSSSRFMIICSSEFTWGKIPSLRPGTITHLNSSPFA